MFALMTIGVFFLVLVVVYPTVCMLIGLSAALRKKRALKTQHGDGAQTIQAINEAADRLKQSAFIISVMVTFFMVAPFIALALMVDLF